VSRGVGIQGSGHRGLGLELRVLPVNVFFGVAGFACESLFLELRVLPVKLSGRSCGPPGFGLGV